MHAKDLKAILDRRPFDPVRLHLSSGEHVDITHPEMAIVSRSTVAVGVHDKDGIADGIIQYNLIHIVKIEQRNGRRTARRRRS